MSPVLYSPPCVLSVLVEFILLFVLLPRLYGIFLAVIHLPALRVHCAGGCWVLTQESHKFNLECLQLDPGLLHWIQEVLHWTLDCCIEPRTVALNLGALYCCTDLGIVAWTRDCCIEPTTVVLNPGLLNRTQDCCIESRGVILLHWT